MEAPVQIRPRWPFAIRLGKEEDRGFVCIGWLKSLRDSHVQQHNELLKFRTAGHGLPSYLLEGFPASVPYHLYSGAQMKRIEAILARPSVVVQVAHNPEDPKHLYGFCVLELEPPKLVTVHYVYVKGFYRRSGMASELLGSLQRFNAVSHSEETINPAARKLIRARRSQFNPGKAWSA